MTKVEMIEKIYEVVKPTFIWIPWHSVCGHKILMIGDVLDWRMKNKKNEFISWMFHDTNYIWRHPRKPIEYQSRECIIYIYNLIKDE